MDNLEFASYLREMADKYEKFPKMAQFFHHGNGGTEIIFCDDLTELSSTVRALGGGDKSSDDGKVEYRPKKYPHIVVMAFHDKVCVKVTTGKRIIPAQPERIVPAQQEQVIPAQPEREEEVSEWVCPAFTKPFVEPAFDALEGPALQLEAAEDVCF